MKRVIDLLVFHSIVSTKIHIYSCFNGEKLPNRRQYGNHHNRQLAQDVIYNSLDISSQPYPGSTCFLTQKKNDSYWFYRVLQAESA